MLDGRRLHREGESFGSILWASKAHRKVHPKVVGPIRPTTTVAEQPLLKPALGGKAQVAAEVSKRAARSSDQSHQHQHHHQHHQTISAHLPHDYFFKIRLLFSGFVALFGESYHLL